MSTQGGCAATGVAWAYEGTLHLTVIAKSSFELRPEAAMHRVEAAPVLERELVQVGRATLLQADEIAPRKPSTDVTLVGHAHVPAGVASPVRLAVYNDSGPLLDKTLEVLREANEATLPLIYEHAYGGPAHPDNPVGVGAADDKEPRIRYRGMATHTAGFAPVSASWVGRAKRLGALSAKALSAAIPTFPAGFDWSYFQAAPYDQQIPFLKGDEWIIVLGAHPEHQPLRTRLPSATAEARVSNAGALSTKPFSLTLDGLHIDMEAMRCHVTWRGDVTVASEAALAEARVEAALGLPDAPITWSDAAPSTGSSTMAISPADVASALRAMGAKPQASETAAVSREDLMKLAARMGGATPFQKETASAAKAPPAPEPAPPPAAAANATVSVSREALGKAITPFANQAPPAPKRRADAPVPGAPWAGQDPTVPAVQPQHEHQRNTLEVSREALAAHTPKVRFHDVQNLGVPPVDEAPLPSPPEPEPIPELTLEAYARLCAELAVWKLPPYLVLRTNDVDDATWDAADARWRKSLARATRRGEREPRRAFDQAFVARWEEIRGKLEDQALALLLNADEDGELDDVLADHDLTHVSWLVVSRVARERFANDEALAARVAQHREQLRARK